VIRRLPNRRCLAPDARGHGKSSRPAEAIRWTQFGWDLAKIAEQLSITGAIGIGHSMGGYAIVSAAALRPSAFSALLLIDPVIPAPEIYGTQRVDGSLIRGRRERWSSPRGMFESYVAQPPFDRWQPEVLNDYCNFGLVPDGGEFVLACPPHVEAAIYEVSTEDAANLHPILPAIQVPVTVLRSGLGNQLRFKTDWSPTDPHVAWQFSRGRDVWLPEYSHFLPMERPDLVAEYISNLIHTQIT
jgi:pimeloyl-ACP methyl ester carboxylesterase